MRPVLSLPPTWPHMSSAQYAVEALLHSTVLDESLQEVDSSLESRLGVPVVQFEHPAECSFGNLSDGNVVLPLQEGLLQLVGLGLPKEILTAHQRGGQKLELGLLFDLVLLQLLFKDALFFIDEFQLAIKLVEVAHIFRVAVLLVLQGLVLVGLELLLVLREDQRLLPELEFLDQPLFGSSGDQVFKVAGERVQADLELAQRASELVQVVLDVVSHDVTVHPALKADFKDRDDSRAVLEVEDGVVDEVLEKIVGHGFDFLVVALDGSMSGHQSACSEA